MDIRLPLALAALGTFALAVVPASASEPGNMMKMNTTVHMKMAGMPAMGPITHSANVCTSAKKPDPAQLMKNHGECKVSDYKQVGDTITYHMECSGRTRMSGDGKFRMLPDSGIQGTIHIAGESGGQPVSMDMAFDGQRTGACAYTPPASEG
jgi:hypothetical protein